MSGKTKLFIFFPLLILVSGFTLIVNAQDEPPASIDANTNKSFYDYGEMIIVNGKIKNYDTNVHSNFTLAYNVTNPKGDMVTSGQTAPNPYGSFSFNFLAGGDLFELSGSYPIQLFFGSIEAEIPMFLSGGESVAIDVTPPIILQPSDIVVEAETSDGVTKVTFDVTAEDDFDKKIQPICKPNSGYLFGIGDTIVKCTAKDSAGHFASPVSFTITVNPPGTIIPNWVKNVAAFWCENEIDDDSFVEGIQYLIDNGIIVVPATFEGYGGSQEIPQWVKNNACWWSDGSITDGDFAYGIEYLVRQGIIRV
ncbi:MAG: HYR domain-containing protein [Nitrosopumilus sp.]|nr:HYR domain-containing protein [Nitrosopumilus sp.]